MTARKLSLPRSTHLRARGDFLRVYKEGNRARGNLMTVVVAAGRTAETRMGLSVGKAVWKSAVRRNRVRRVFREAFRLARAELPAGFDLVLIGSRPKIRPQLEETRRELLELTRKAHGRYLEKCRARAGSAAGAAGGQPGPGPGPGQRAGREDPDRPEGAAGSGGR